MVNSLRKVDFSHPTGRDVGTRGGGQSWGNFPPELGSCGAQPRQLWTVDVVH